MLNIRHILTTTAISILFGVYSIYNVIEYIKINDKNVNIKISKLSKQIDRADGKASDMNLKYALLHKKCSDMHVEIIKLHKIIDVLKSELEKHNNEKKVSNELVIMNDDNEHHLHLLVETEEVICDEVCEANKVFDLTKQTMFSITDDKLNQHDYETVSVDLSDTSSITSATTRTRTPSLSEINWLGLARKFIVGF